jgi:hypothetical protein
MRHLKSLGLLAAVAAVMALAGTASATTLTSPEGTTYTGEFILTSTNSKWHGPFVTVECSHSGIKGTVKTHGSGGVGVTVSSLTFTGCNYTTHVKAGGSLDINSSNGVSSTGAAVEIQTSVGTCVFTTNGTTLGSVTEGSGSTLDVNSAKIPKTGGSFLCGSSGTWTGSYSLTTPGSAWVD